MAVIVGVRGGHFTGSAGGGGGGVTRCRGVARDGGGCHLLDDSARGLTAPAHGTNCGQTNKHLYQYIVYLIHRDDDATRKNKQIV